MSRFVFPDNTVLCNFAAVRRLDVLESVLNGRGRWTEAVAHEADQSSRVLPALAAVARDGWLGDPVEINDPRDIDQIERVRRAVFGGSDERPLQHLGEAQTCHVVRHWPQFTGSVWVSDDREALRYARFQGITTWETVDLMMSAVADGDTSEAEAFQLLRGMTDAGRHLRVPASAAELRR